MSVLLRPADGVFIAAIDEDLVVLDSRRESYLCIPGGAHQLGYDPTVGGFLTGEPEAAALQQAGLATTDQTTHTFAPLMRLPTSSLAFQAPIRLRPRDVWRLSACVLDWLCHYRGRPLSHVLAFVATRRHSVRGTPDALPELVRRFHSAVVWLPDTRKCLARSFLLLCFLHRSGCDATWMFGVRTWPFAAHCWLQAGDAVLDDAAELLRLYAPIRAA
jgi:hypothetical protein